MGPVTAPRSSGASADSAGSDPTCRCARLEALAAYGGEVAAAQRAHALAVLDDGDGVPPAVRRVVSTLAVRLTVGVLALPAAGLAHGDAEVAAAVDTLFVPDE